MFYLYPGQPHQIFDRESLKTPKSRLATEAKAEFTKVNEHFADGV
jgi:hypothetical protein